MTYVQSTLNFPIKMNLTSGKNSSKLEENKLLNKDNDSKIPTRRSTRLIKVTPRKSELFLAQRTPKSSKRTSSSSEENSEDSPPKREKKKEEKSDSDTNSESPSVLISALKINSPKDEKENATGKLTPKRLFKDNKGSSLRNALHSCSGVTSMPGREEELKQLREFLKTRIENDKSGSMYISGPPGTGKTATLELVMKDKELATRFRCVYINCTSMQSAASIYGRICQELNIKGYTKSSEKKSLAALEKYLSSKHKMILLVLDEVDQLTTRDQAVLYTIFEWPAMTNSRLALVTISNTLDLTDRVLPRLHINSQLLPQHLIFRPYTTEQITSIIIDRLSDCNEGAFPLPALRLLAAKVSAISGDARRALDIARRAVETSDLSALAKEEKQEQKENSNAETKESPKPSPQKPAVEVKQVLKVINSVYGNSMFKDNDEENEIPLYQQIALATLLLIKRHARNKDLTISKFYEIYKQVCQKRFLTSDQSEFVSICKLIETRGVWRIIGKKNILLCKISLQWDEDEVCSALRDKNLLSDILSDTSCLNKTK